MTGYSYGDTIVVMDPNPQTTQPDSTVNIQSEIKNGQGLRKKKKLLFFIIFFILLLVILAISYLIFNNKNSAGLSSPNNISPTPAALIQERQTYTYVYSFADEKFSEIAKINGHAEPILGKDNSVYYYIYETSDPSYRAQKIFKLDLETEQTSVIYATNSGKIAEIKYENPNLLYIVILPQNESYDEQTHDLLKLNLDNKQAQFLRQFKSVTFGGISYLFKSGETDIIGSFGGDGCGGHGRISRYQNSNSVLITNTGGGCNPNPIYIGSVPEKNSILVASATETEEATLPGDFIDFDKLYLQNVLTNEKDILYDLRPIDDQINQFKLNKDKNAAVILKDKELISIDLSTKEVSLIELPEDIRSQEISVGFIWSKNDKFYFIVSRAINETENSKELYIFDSKSNSFKKIDFTNTLAKKSPSLTAIGDWKDQEILYFIDYPKN